MPKGRRQYSLIWLIGALTVVAMAIAPIALWRAEWRRQQAIVEVLNPRFVHWSGDGSKSIGAVLQRALGPRVVSLEVAELGADEMKLVAQLTDLEYLECDAVLTTDLAGLRPLRKLRSLRLSGPQLSDVSVLGEFRRLELLVLTDCPYLADVRCLENCRKLRTLAIVRTMVRSISGFERLLDLERLHLVRNDVRDLQPLSNLRRLERLDLTGNPVEDISPLQGLANLRVLRLNGTLVTDLSPLRQMHVEELVLSGMKVENEFLREFRPIILRADFWPPEPSDPKKLVKSPSENVERPPDEHAEQP
ncbi:MAG: leucine-rich repeat domain-containing protein [Pirellulales bacterium]